ncbi:MAG: cell division protein SepF [Clostridiales bacterium]|nr:cell division protein SepF [Clostridiales bacterium]
MGNFNIKEFFGGMFSPVATPEDNFDENYYEEESYIEEPEVSYEEEPVVEEQPYVAEPRAYVQEQPAVTTPVVQQNATVIMLTPYDIRTSQVVCDHIRDGHIVICNLTNTDKNQRVVDYISGGVYALGGRVEPTPVKTTFVCTPKSVNLVIENSDAAEQGTKVSAL